MPASNLRLEDIAIFNYIKYGLLPTEFSEQITGEALIYDPTLGAYKTESSMEPLPTSAGRGWVCFDDYTVNGSLVVDTESEQASKVSVVGASTYAVDYLHGRIYNPDSVPTSVSYYWHYISVLDAWPGIDPPPLPIVSVGVDRSVKEGFQLGGGVKTVREFSIYVFGTSRGERDDITEVIHSNLFNRQIMLKDFSTGDYLNYDGTFNTGFSPTLLASSSLNITSTEARNINIWSDWSDLNKYRSVISGEYETFTESG